jgi:hypothetical protein
MSDVVAEKSKNAAPKQSKKSASKKATKAPAKSGRMGAESGPKIGLIAGLMEPETRTVFMTSESAETIKEILGSSDGLGANEALIAATLSAMSGRRPRLPKKQLPVAIELTQPKPVWAFQESLAEETGCTLEEVQEALLKLYVRGTP